MTTLPAPTSKVLRPAEAAKYLAVSRTTLYEMCQRRELPCIKIGTRSTRLLQADLDDYLAAHRVSAVNQQ